MVDIAGMNFMGDNLEITAKKIQRPTMTGDVLDG